MNAFTYKAGAPDGQAISGSINAPDEASARQKLAALNLTGIEIAAPVPAMPARPMGAADFQSFNQQLAQLAKAGLPIEEGIRVIAQDMRSGRLRRTLNALSAELESGASLPAAIEAHRGEFPALYSHLIDAGIQTGNLPGVLLGLGRQLRIKNQLSTALWQALTYPAICFAGIVAVFIFMASTLYPQFAAIFKDFRVELPMITQFGLAIGQLMHDGGSAVVLSILGVGLLCFLLLWVIRPARIVTEKILIRVPLIGAVLRNALIARWCDGVGLGVRAGLDLPRAITLTGETIAEPRLAEDGNRLIRAVVEGHPASSARLQVLPQVLGTTIELASQRNNLAEALEQFSSLYQEQGQRAIGTIYAVLTPALLLILGLAIFLMILMFIAPLIALISAPWK